MPRTSPASTERRRRQRAQSFVEAAITLPVLLLLALGVTDIGRAFYYREAVGNSVRQALRIAVSPAQHATGDAVCAGAGSGPVSVSNTTTIGSAGGAIASIANQAGLESSSNGTPSGSAIAGARITVTFHCHNGAAVTNATSDGSGPLLPGSDSVTVTITQTLPVITPVLTPVIGPSIAITVTSFERSEY